MLTLEDIAGAVRLVAVDAETTGHWVPTPEQVSRMPKGMRPPGVIIQLGCVELLRDGDGWRTGETWESLVNPDGPLKPASMAIHGIRPAALRTAPRFPGIREAFESFVGGCPMVAHSAGAETDYLNWEMRRAGLVAPDACPYHQGMFLDTQVIARGVFPGAPGSLDALCDRLWIDRSDRFAFHGALLDAQLTAEAFVKMSTGFVQEETRTMSFG